MKLIYNVEDKPQVSERIVFAFQQLLAIMAATIAVPAIVGNGMTASAALFGAGIGTLVYQLFTKFRSPVFLGSSFAFLPSMFAAFAGGVSMSLGFLGLIMGAVFAGLVYVVFAILVKSFGVQWINKLMPAVIIGPIVAIIGLSLAGNAVGDMVKGDVGPMVDGALQPVASPYVALICALVTLFVVILCSVYGSKKVRLIPFILGILAGYAVAACFTLIGSATNNEALKVIDFAPFTSLFQGGVSLKTFLSAPQFAFLVAKDGLSELNGTYVLSIFFAYVPVAAVVFAEHLADHKNLSTIIERDLTKDPGLDKTLLGDGIGSMAGAFFGGCPNTTYGESIGCVAITQNASVITVTYAAFLSILVAFVSPLVAFLDSIPPCVMGGVCMTLYGFIAVSGLKMLQPVDLNDNRNLFVASVILISGVGGLSLTFATSKGDITITTVACALILGIVTNLIVRKGATPAGEEPKPQQLIK
jgi:uracil permease